MLRGLSNVMRPARFQGAGRRRAYFEGYYLKVVDARLGAAVAVIPGVSYDAAGVGHAFVQVLDGAAGAASYHRYDVAAFGYGDAALPEEARALRRASVASERTHFGLRVGDSWFCESGCSVRVPDLELTVGFRQNQPWPWRPWHPGAMGPFSFAPGMQCRHGVVSLWHEALGRIAPQGEGGARDLRGVGYIEKDWGRSFPRGWVWLQTNHLDGVDGPACVMVSAGVVPWVTGAFAGFIAAVLWEGRLEVFATYNGARMRRRIGGDAARLRFVRGRLALRIAVAPGPGVDLVAPAGSGGMVGRVNESLTSTAAIEVWEGRRTILATTARWVGFEAGGEEW